MVSEPNDDDIHSLESDIADNVNTESKASASIPAQGDCIRIAIGNDVEHCAERVGREAESLSSVPPAVKQMNVGKDELGSMGPEDLVRRETKVVNILRAMLLVINVTVGVFLSFWIYRLSRKWEDETFRKDFDQISSRFTLAFTTELGQVFLNAYAFGITVSSSSNLINAVPNITIPLDKLATGAVQTSHFYRAFWSPLITNATERHEWEAYAQDQMNSSGGSLKGNTCFVCGGSDLEVGAPSVEVALPIGTYTCANIQWAGQNGLASPSDCVVLHSYVQANCQCRPVVNKLMDANKTNSRASLDRIYEVGPHGAIPVVGPGPYSPIWQVYPPGDWASIALFDLFSSPASREALNAMISTRKTVLSKTFYTTSPNLWSKLLPDTDPKAISILLSPVMSGQANSNQIVGSIAFEIDWAYLLGSSVPLSSNGVLVVLENSCGQAQTFVSTGSVMHYLGEGDLHDPKFSSMVAQSTFADYIKVQNFASPSETGETSPSDCSYRVSVYPSDEFRSNFYTDKPRVYATTVILIFVFTCTLFVVYDCYVSRRQRKVMQAALERDEIVSSLFPSKVRERLFQVNGGSSGNGRNLIKATSPRTHLRQLLSTTTMVIQRASPMSPISDPIAEFFPNVSVVFADISGFTAWSSEREPSQVFQLLETVYQAFDKVAHRFGIFKVETIGDCYVAAAGVPMHQPDHAVRVVKFAYECLIHMHELTHELEAILGPSTSNLSIRIGVHSGPVIAGVLRGEKSRFQLFGDTMNTAARMQTTGETNKIQISSTTAHLLEKDGHSSWIRKRDKPVTLKGKGLVQTFWADLLPEAEHDDDVAQSIISSHVCSFGETQDSSLLGASTHTRAPVKMTFDDKRRRMVSWNTDLLMRSLKKVVMKRNATRARGRKHPRSRSQTSIPTDKLTPLESVTEIISVQEFTEKAARVECDPESLDLGEAVRSQLFEYISIIASMYRDNPFHNFEHASHVAMSAAKVVMRIIAPDLNGANEVVGKGRKGIVALKRSIHVGTFGISSDALMQFAVVFSAIIHDVDHSGVSNDLLIKEAQPVALKYNNKCVAEQNSVDIAWHLLQGEKFTLLRKTICENNEEEQRFRQLLVNAVIATDIADKDLQQQRKKRWDKAFQGRSDISSALAEDKNDMDRRATIVFEYIIQASDVAHTMQHWNVYKRWNERLFEERYIAYLQGREPDDPSKGWYKGEIWFFDHYIIPLAKKLETCGVFGVSSDEYLSYALENRHEWEIKGEDIVKEMVEKYSRNNEMGPLEEGMQHQRLCTYALEA